MATMEREREAVTSQFDRVTTMVSIAHRIERVEPEAATELVRVSQSVLSEVQPVRVLVAARLLDVSDRTVRTWVDKGLLQPTQRSHRRLLLDAERLYQVLSLVRDLRAHGQNRDLTTSLWRRLEDQALLDDSDLQTSLGQLRSGHRKPALTLDEEQRAANSQ